MGFSAGSHRCRWPAVLLVTASCGLLAGACSYGDTRTPDCDPTAAPNATNSCLRTPECDQGNGVVVASDSCCVKVGNYHYGACEGALQGDGFDFRTVCGDAGTSGCCNEGQSNYASCMAGKYPISVGSQTTSTTSSSTTTTTGGGGGGG